MKFSKLVLAHCLTATLVLFGLNQHAYSQSGDADTTNILRLEKLLQELKANNPSLRAARLEADVLATRSQQVSTLPDPSLGISYQPRPILTARGYQRSQWSIQQTIPFPGKLELRGEIASLTSEMADDRAAAFGQDLALQLKKAYYELYRIQEQQQLIATFQKELRQFEKVAATRYAVGTGTQQAILKAQLERNRLRIRRQKLDADRQSALQTLARLLNRPDTTGLTGRIRVEKPSPPQNTQQLVALALQRRPELDALRHAQARADRKIDLAQKEFWPDFSVGLKYFDLGAGGPMPLMTGRDAFTLNLGIKIPLWRGRLQANLAEAQIQEQRVKARYQAFTAKLRTKIAGLTGRIEQQQQQLALFRETLIPQAETTLEATLSAYTTGQVDFLDLLDAERTLFDLKMDYQDTYARYLKTIAALEHAVGFTIVE